MQVNFSPVKLFQYNNSCSKPCPNPAFKGYECGVDSFSNTISSEKMANIYNIDNYYDARSDFDNDSIGDTDISDEIFTRKRKSKTHNNSDYFIASITGEDIDEECDPMEKFIY